MFFSTIDRGVGVLSRSELDDEDGTFSFSLRFRPDTPAVGFDDLFGDKEAVAGGVDVDLYRILAVATRGEELRHVVRRDADAAVLHGKPDDRAVGESDLDATGGRIPYRVVDEVAQDMPPDLVFVALEQKRSLADPEFDCKALFVRGRLQLSHDLPYRRAKIELLLRVRNRSLLKIRGVENVHDGGDASAHARKRLCRHRSHNFRHGAEISLDDGGEAGLTLREVALDLVADEVQEAFLLLVDYLEFFLLFLDKLALFYLPAHVLDEDVAYYRDEREREDGNNAHVFNGAQKEEREHEYGYCNHERLRGNYLAVERLEPYCTVGNEC